MQHFGPFAPLQDMLYQVTRTQVLDRHVLHRDLTCAVLSPRRTSDASMRCSE